MFSTTDTIVAVATPPGRGGIGVVRLSGREALRVAAVLLGRTRPLTPRHATLARVEIDASVGAGSTGLDQVIATYFPAPASYTGEDVVEISAHGSPLVLRLIVAAALKAGARLAEPGEFTLRAFLNGRIDLVQAEAVADLVDAVTPLQARVAFDQLEGTLTKRIGEVDARLFDLMARLEASIDFPDEGYHFVEPEGARRELAEIAAGLDRLIAEGARGRLVREGRQVAIVGKPNVGKSSLFNALVGADRAIVTEQPGTTRDLVTETADVDGLALTFVDTAGVRDARDAAEAEGVRRARAVAQAAELVVVVLDRARPLDRQDRDLLGESARGLRVVAVNKIDLPPRWTVAALGLDEQVVEISLRTGENLDTLRTVLVNRLLGSESRRDVAGISNIRHLSLVERARQAIGRAMEALGGASPAPEEFVLVDLEEAGGALEEITGRRVSDATLRHIFERFCIGK